MVLGKISQYRQLEHLTLEGLHHEDKPKENSRQSDNYVNYRDQERPEKRDKKNHQSGKPQSSAQSNDRAAKQQRLDGMETQKAILSVRVDHQKHNCRHEREISQRARKIYR